MDRLFQEKREKQRLQLEQEARGESEDNASTKSSISITEPESKIELMQKLMTVISVEKIPGIMAVRKGRVSCLPPEEIPLISN
jgi:predicted Zn-dependent peptidase